MENFNKLDRGEVLQLENSPLGKQTGYVDQYQPGLLFAIPRQIKRNEIKVPERLPFKGCDVWTAYELSWLDSMRKPQVGVAEFIFPCETPNIIESKSFKLYLYSLNNTQFSSQEKLIETLKQDLSSQAGLSIMVNLMSIKDFSNRQFSSFAGISLDNLKIQVDKYEIEPAFLDIESDQEITETLYSDLLKSNCLVTGQPDWGSVKIEYSGKKIMREGLLKYLISFRNHNEFHEQCVERIFMDIYSRCTPRHLTVEARYTRRGGLEINPFRSTCNTLSLPIRLFRQ